MWSSVIVSSSVPDRTGVGGASAVFRTPDCRLRHQAKCAARSQRRDSAKSPLIGPLSDQDRNRHPGKVESDTRERWGQAACAGHIRSDCGGERAAVIYALIGTAKLDDVDLQASLADVLDRIGEMPQTRLNELLRWHWKAEQQQALAA